METLILALEERSFRAWPALETRHYDGWLLRFAEGYTRRANSINPIYSSMEPLEDKIHICEDVYRAHNITPCFKMTPLAQPHDLDDELEKRGYVKQSRTYVQTLNLDQFQGEVSPEAHIDGALTEEWIQQFIAMNSVDPKYSVTMQKMLNSIAPQTAFMTLFDDGQVIGTGLGVLDGDFLGLFDIVTEPHYRGRGKGRSLMTNLLAWGKANGARHAYLQVMANNAPALRLYDTLGFREVYQYWYRVKA